MAEKKQQNESMSQYINFIVSKYITSEIPTSHTPSVEYNDIHSNKSKDNYQNKKKYITNNIKY